MTHEQSSEKDPVLPRNIGKQIWAALADAFLPFDSGVIAAERPSLQMNATSTVYAQEIKNGPYPVEGHGATISTGTAPILELIEMEMRIRLKWLSH